MRIARRVRAASEDELPQHQYAVLVELDEHGTCLIGELAQREGVASPVMTRNVNALERLGLVQRAPTEEDGRQVRIAITADGIDLKRRIKNNRDEWMARRLRKLAPEEVALLERATILLQRVERM